MRSCMRSMCCCYGPLLSLDKKMKSSHWNRFVKKHVRPVGMNYDFSVVSLVRLFRRYNSVRRIYLCTLASNKLLYLLGTTFFFILNGASYLIDRDLHQFSSGNSTHLSVAPSNVFIAEYNSR